MENLENIEQAHKTLLGANNKMHEENYIDYIYAAINV